MRMPFSDIELSRRLERAEGLACVEFAQARSRLFPESGAAWIENGGTYAVFDGVESPATQTFGFGLFEEPSADSLALIEQFFFDRGAPVCHEVSPLAGTAALNLLCARNYRPIEISSVLYQHLGKSDDQETNPTQVRVVGPEEMKLWTETCTRGWTHEHPELLDFFLQFGGVSSARLNTVCFLAELEGRPAAAGALSLHDGVALLGGASTIPEMRRRGMQSALLRERLRYAFDHGCDLAAMAAEAGSDSQRNAERKGFRIAYTRIKWQLAGKSV